MCGKGLENTTLSYGGGYLPRLVCYGACSNFSCKMALQPAPVISWLKNNAFHNKKLQMGMGIYLTKARSSAQPSFSGLYYFQLKVTIHLSRDTPNIPLSKPGINQKISYFCNEKKKKAMKSLLETSLSSEWSYIYIFYPNENERLTKLRLSSFWSILNITDSNAPDK